MKLKIPIFALAALFFAGLWPASSNGAVAISVGFAPPVIPIYQQPYAPGPGYLWTPGYWSYADFGYYWVPGVWVRPPRIGFLWTPGYWGYNGGQYIFNDGYWGPTVGFYGGINYGFGYGGSGYYGGRWAGNNFQYNTAVTRVNRTVINNNYTYVNKEAVNKGNTGSRAGFNGPGGAKAKASKQEQAAARAKHVPATSAQRSRREEAKKDPALHAANNKGKPKADAVRSQGGAANNQAQGARKSKPANQANVGQRANAGKRENAERQTAGQRAPRDNGQATLRERPATRNATRTPRGPGNEARPGQRASRQPQEAQRRPVTRSTRQVGPRREAGPRPGQRGPVKGEQPRKKKKDQRPEDR